MMTIDYITHTDCSREQLLEICRFKNLNWQYPIESHLAWLDRNLLPNDTHVLLSDGNTLVGYLNIVNLVLDTDGTQQPALGIGNVCVHPDYKGLSLGALLMSAAKYYCRRNNRIGVLLCQDKNTAFYNACNWHRFAGTVSIPSHDNTTNINFYSTVPLSCKTLNCNRDF